MKKTLNIHKTSIKKKLKTNFEMHNFRQKDTFQPNLVTLYNAIISSEHTHTQTSLLLQDMLCKKHLKMQRKLKIFCMKHILHKTYTLTLFIIPRKNAI